MLANRKLILDTFCEVYDLLKPSADGEFWDFTEHELVPGAIYLFGREQFNRHVDKIKPLAENQVILPALSNPAEGSSTMYLQAQRLGILDLVRQGKMFIIAGGDMPADVPALVYENFMPKLLDYTENRQAAEVYQKDFTVDRPYKFLFLNGRARPHRKYLIERFRLSGLLDKSIWSNLDTTLAGSRSVRLMHDNQDLLLVPGQIQTLDPEYEFAFYRSNTVSNPTGFIKYELFNNQWGEIYLTPKPYLDTYFSLVTETVFEYPHSFRTEKIWKPICIGHPFIVASNAGYYRDLHNLGYKTFGHLVDESFDTIINDQDRIERIASIVEDLCSQDLSGFVLEAQEVCKYNQQLLAELSPQVRRDFPTRFTKFIQTLTDD